MTKITLSVIWLSFCFANDNQMISHLVYILKKIVNRIGVSSGLYYFLKYEPDGVSSGSHLQNDNGMALHPVYNFFQNVNRMTLHLVVKLSNRKSCHLPSIVSQLPN